MNSLRASMTVDDELVVSAPMAADDELDFPRQWLQAMSSIFAPPCLQPMNSASPQLQTMSSIFLRQWLPMRWLALGLFGVAPRARRAIHLMIRTRPELSRPRP